jgi:hypothetical protein
MVAFSLLSCTRPPAGPAGSTPTPVSTRTILIAKEQPMEQERTLLELVRSRLPVVVEQGRFRTEDGITNTCVYSRRSSGRHELSMASNGLPVCPMLPAYLDGVGIGDVGTYLAHVRARQFESVELLSSSDAMQRYGFSATGSDALVIWTRGRGPHADSKTHHR